MNIERTLRLMAGTVVLASVGLTLLHSQYWLILTAFVGFNLFQSGITNWCPAMLILKRLGLPSCGEAAVGR